MGSKSPLLGCKALSWLMGPALRKSPSSSFKPPHNNFPQSEGQIDITVQNS